MHFYIKYLTKRVPIMKFLISQKTQYFKAHFNQSCEVNFLPVLGCLLTREAENP